MFRSESIVVVGSSGAGKTSLVRGLQGSEYEGEVVTPLRYVTRDSRADDHDSENRHLNRGRFFTGVLTNFIDPVWYREMDGGRIEYYGFRACEPDETRLRIYSANNAFLRNPNPSVRNVLATAMVVMLEAERDIREARLLERSPDMSASELSNRLEDTTADLSYLEGYFINTSGLSIAESQETFRHIVGMALGHVDVA